MKAWRGTSCWLHPKESDPGVDQAPGVMIISSTWLCPIFVWLQQNYLRLLKTLRYSDFSQDCCSRKTTERNSVFENEWMKTDQLFKNLFFSAIEPATNVVENRSKPDDFVVNSLNSDHSSPCNAPRRCFSDSDLSSFHLSPMKVNSKHLPGGNDCFLRWSTDRITPDRENNARLGIYELKRRNSCLVKCWYMTSILLIYTQTTCQWPKLLKIIELLFLVNNSTKSACCLDCN